MTASSTWKAPSWSLAGISPWMPGGDRLHPPNAALPAPQPCTEPMWEMPGQEKKVSRNLSRSRRMSQACRSRQFCASRHPGCGGGESPVAGKGCVHAAASLLPWGLVWGLLLSGSCLHKTCRNLLSLEPRALSQIWLAAAGAHTLARRVCTHTLFS